MTVIVKKPTLANVAVNSIFTVKCGKAKVDFRRTSDQIGQMIFVVNQLTGELVKMGGNKVVL